MPGGKRAPGWLGGVLTLVAALAVGTVPTRADTTTPPLETPASAPAPPAEGTQRAAPPPPAGAEEGAPAQPDGTKKAKSPDGTKSDPPSTAGSKKSTPKPGTAAEQKEDEEIRLGRQAAAEMEQQYKLVKDAKQLARLARIGKDVAAASGSHYHFTFKILDTDEVNAVSLPGGFTYVTKGMLSYVRSDDELAGVLAHEIAHAARHHVLQLLKREAKMNQTMMLGLLGAVLLGGARSDSLANVLVGAELVKTAYLNRYSLKVESEADHYGAIYMIKTHKYNPVGILTVIERLARDDARRAGPEMGIFQDHPDGSVRAKALEDYLVSQHVTINRLAVQDNLHALARETTVRGAKAAEVVLNGVVVYQCADGLEGAVKIADHINRLMGRNLQMRDVCIGPDRASVLARGETIVTVTDCDAELQSKQPAEVAAAAARSLETALWKAYMDQVP